MDYRPPIDYVSIEGDPSIKLTVVTKPNLADDPLVVGPRYQPTDIRCTWSSYLGVNTSGVLCKFYVVFKFINHYLYIFNFCSIRNTKWYKISNAYSK